MAAQEEFSFQDLFGISNLVKNDGTEVPVTSLNGKHIALYASASWCGPCQQVTPMLAAIYPMFKEEYDVEFVLLPFCRTEQKFNEYFQKMPWPSVPYSQKKAVGDRLPINVKGFPTIFIIDPQGNLVTSKGLEGILKDPQNFPWRPPAWEDFFPAATFKRNDGSMVESSALANKTLMVYFSAHWCPPCRAFTPQLAEFYNKYHGEKNFEIIFVSKDRDLQAFQDYFAEHPWLAVPYENKALRDNFVEYLPHNGIPTLAMVSADGEIQRMDTRMCLVFDQEGADYPWHVDTFVNPRKVNEQATVLFFQQNDTPEKQREREAWLAQPSLEARQKLDEQEWNYISVRTVEDGSIEDQILEKCGEAIPESGEAMVLLKLYEGGFFYVAPLPNTEEDFQNFIQGSKDGTLERHQMI